MSKNIRDDAKTISKWFKDMTTWENIRFTLVFITLIIGVPVALFALGFVSKEFYEFMSGLYKQADPGDKFNGILTILVFLVGIVLGSIVRRKKKT